MNEEDQINFWKPHFEARKKRGISRVAYCRENNLIESRMYYWEGKILGRRKKETGVGKRSFTPIVVEGIGLKEGLVHIRLAGGIAIILDKLPEVNWVLELNKRGVIP